MKQVLTPKIIKLNYLFTKVFESWKSDLVIIEYKSLPPYLTSLLVSEGIYKIFYLQLFYFYYIYKFKKKMLCMMEFFST